MERDIHKMKVFISWSGNLSCEIAKVLKKWIPCIIQSVDVFFSSEDIEKGNDWDKIISTELEECNYGIVCLTKDNVDAPWLNFEAGAIAKSLDSKVSSLMVNIKPSDMKGPISRYQATKIEKEDFFKLLVSINIALERPLETEILKNTFDIMWDKFEKEIIDVISRNVKAETSEKSNKKLEEENLVEEILQILRQNNAILSNPNKLIPVDYWEYVQKRLNNGGKISSVDKETLFIDLFMYIEYVLEYVASFPSNTAQKNFLEECNFYMLLNIVYKNAGRTNNHRIFEKARMYVKEYENIINR